MGRFVGTVDLTSDWGRKIYRANLGLVLFEKGERGEAVGDGQGVEQVLDYGQERDDVKISLLQRSEPKSTINLCSTHTLSS